MIPCKSYGAWVLQNFNDKTSNFEVPVKLYIVYIYKYRYYILY